MRRMIQQTCHTALLKHTCLSTFILCTSFIIPYINLLVSDVYRKQKYLYLKLTHISNWSRLDHTLKHTVAADKVFFEEDNSRAPIPAAALLLWLVVQLHIVVDRVKRIDRIASFPDRFIDLGEKFTVRLGEKTKALSIDYFGYCDWFVILFLLSACVRRY